MPPLAALQAAQVAQNGSSSSALSQCSWGGGKEELGTWFWGGLGARWRHPSTLSSLAPSALGLLGSSAPSEPLWCLLTRLSKGLVVAGDLGDCAVSALCGVCSALAAHCGVRVAGWMCTVLSAACLNTT